MNSKEFDTIVKQTCLDINDTLIKKGGEYAPGDVDRLHNFRVAATLAGTTMREALAGMMIKHTVSVYDMLYAGHEFTEAQWNEKIGDHLNYLVLLKAVLAEEELEFPKSPGEMSVNITNPNPVVNDVTEPVPYPAAASAQGSRLVQSVIHERTAR